MHYCHYCQCASMPCSMSLGNSYGETPQVGIAEGKARIIPRRFTRLRRARTPWWIAEWARHVARSSTKTRYFAKRDSGRALGCWDSNKESGAQHEVEGYDYLIQFWSQKHSKDQILFSETKHFITEHIQYFELKAVLLKRLRSTRF